MISGNFTTMGFCDAVYVSPKVVIHKGDLVPFVEMASVETGNRKDAKTIEFRKYSGGAKFEKGDTVIASIEPCLQHGKSFYFSEYDKGAGSTEFLVFRGVEGVTTNQFVYYFMMSYEIRAAMIRSMKGATGRQRVDPDVFDGMRISLPDIQYQTRIASILSNYDSAIANCRRQIALLEEAAMRLYKEWFKDERGEKKISAYELCDIMSGGTPSTKNDSFYSGNIPFFTPADSHGHSCIIDTEKHLSELGLSKCNSKLFPCGTVMVTARGTVGNVVFTCEPMAMNQSCYALKFKDETLPSTILHFILKNEIRQIKKAASSGVFDAIVVDTFKMLKLPKITPSEVASMQKRLLPIYNTEESLIRQIRTLSEARDRLLPKLMKGEIAV